MANYTVEVRTRYCSDSVACYATLSDEYQFSCKSKHGVTGGFPPTRLISNTAYSQTVTLGKLRSRFPPLTFSAKQWLHCLSEMRERKVCRCLTAITVTLQIQHFVSPKHEPAVLPRNLTALKRMPKKGSSRQGYNSSSQSRGSL